MPALEGAAQVTVAVGSLACGVAAVLVGADGVPVGAEPLQPVTASV